MQGEDGTYSMTAVGDGDKGIPFVDIPRDFGRCVQAVVNAKAGINFFALSEMVSWNQYLSTWSESQGVPRGTFNQVPLEHFEVLLPGGLGRESGRMFYLLMSLVIKVETLWSFQAR